MLGKEADYGCSFAKDYGAYFCAGAYVACFGEALEVDTVPAVFCDGDLAIGFEVLLRGGGEVVSRRPSSQTSYTLTNV